MELNIGLKAEANEMRTSQKCSFSIEHILRLDDKKEMQKDDKEILPCCHSSSASLFGEDTIHKELSTKLRRSYRPLSPYPIYRYPVCSVPKNPIIHSDHYVDLYFRRSVPKYLSLPSSAPRVIHDARFIQGSSMLGLTHGLFRYNGERDLATSIGYISKQPEETDDMNDSKRKGGQVRFSHVQSVELERIFSVQKYISPQERKHLSRFLHLSERQVKTWFQNRRAKWRRIKIETEMRRRLAHEKSTRQLFMNKDENRSEQSYSSKFDDEEKDPQLIKDSNPNRLF